MAARSASCADCGATVVATSATPVVRAKGVVLLCAACRGAAPRPPAPAPPPADEDDDYDDMVISAEPADEEGGGEPSASRGEGAAPPQRGVVHSEFNPSVSGDIDTGNSPPDDPDSP